MKVIELFKRLRKFIICFKKGVDDFDSVLEDIDDLQWFGNPIYKQSIDN